MIKDFIKHVEPNPVKANNRKRFLGVDSIMCPPFDRIDELGVETTKNPVEANMVIKKKKPNTLHNRGQAQKLAEDGCSTSNIMSTPSVSDEKISEQVCVAVADEEDKSSEISHISLVRSPVGHLRKKLLILDLNGLLADIVQFAPNNYKPDFLFAGRALFKRPFCRDFLEFCFERFEVGVWSSRARKNVASVTGYLMEDMKHKLLLCWDQFHCTSPRFNTIENKEKPLFFKELRKLWEKCEPDLPWESGEYNEANTLLLDDSPYKALVNPVNTAIFPHTYRHTDVKDTSLGPGGDLRVYLEGLAMAENVQKYVEQNPFGQPAITESNPSWGFYRTIIDNCIATSRRCQYTSLRCC